MEEYRIRQVKANHTHGGLVNSGDSSHINAALQALLHVPMVESFVVNDSEHRKTCRSFLKCSVCALYGILKSFKDGKMGNPSFFVNKWRVLSSALSEPVKVDPHEVLYFFLAALRLDFLEQRNSMGSYDLEAFQNAPINRFFQLQLCREGICASCGYHVSYTHSLSIRLSNELSDSLKQDLNSFLWRQEEETCTVCKNVQASYETAPKCLPPNLVIHCKRVSPDFKLELEMTLSEYDYEYSFTSFIAKVSPKRCIFVSICPDGRVRQFEDTEIKVLSRGQVVQSDYFRLSELTFIYCRRNTSLKQGAMKLNKISTRSDSASRGFKIVSFPKLQPCDVPEGPLTHRSVGTETCISTCDIGVQTDPLDERIVYFDKCKNDKKFQFFTGISVPDFLALYDLIGGDGVVRHLKLNYRLTTPKKYLRSKLSGKDRLFMFLLRLRRGLPLEELAWIFGISTAYVGEICYVVTRLVYLTLKSLQGEMFLSAAQQRLNMPKVMKPFKNLRVILDGASFYIQKPSNFEHQGNTFSKYKSTNVVHFIVGVSTEAATIFCSQGNEGNMSEKEAVLKSGLLHLLHKGDGVMTDRGFDLTAELARIGCFFYKPPSLGERKCLSPEEEILTKALASARIYSEHAIADIKDNRLLQGVMPLTLLPVISDLVYIAAVLRNFYPTRITNVRVVAEDSEISSEKIVGNARSNQDPDEPDIAMDVLF